MSGFNQQTLKYNVQNSNNVTVHIGDIPVAFGQTFTFATTFGAQNLYGVGAITPQEIQQLLASMTITVDAFQLSEQGLRYFNYPSTYSEVLFNNKFDIVVLDSQGNTKFTYIGAVCDNQSVNIPTNQVLMESLTFQAQDVLAANGLSIFAQPPTVPFVGFGPNA
jgi:hypothetical protein